MVKTTYVLDMVKGANIISLRALHATQVRYHDERDARTWVHYGGMSFSGGSHEHRFQVCTGSAGC